MRLRIHSLAFWIWINISDEQRLTLAIYEGSVLLPD